MTLNCSVNTCGGGDLQHAVYDWKLMRISVSCGVSFLFFHKGGGGGFRERRGAFEGRIFGCEREWGGGMLRNEVGDTKDI